MMRWSTTADRGAVTLAAALCVAAAAPLVAQHAAGPAPPASASEVQATSPSTPLPGPRLRPEWRQVESSFADSSATAPMAATAAAGSNTITISTLVLVLVVIIIVLLIT
jgi:hypothetical protein